MGHRGDIEQPCGPPAGESVDGRFCNITDTQKPVFQVNHYIFVERFPNSHDLNNLTPYSFNAQESGARISEVEPSGKVLVMMPQIACSLSHSLRCLINIAWHSLGEEAGICAVYLFTRSIVPSLERLYRLLYLPTQIRVPFGGQRVTCRGLKLTNSLARIKLTNSLGNNNLNFGLARDHVVHRGKFEKRDL